MVKRVAAVLVALLAVLAIAAGALYVRGVRIGFDGSRIPRFLTTAPDYDALEADRARQRKQLPADTASAGAPEPGLEQVAALPPSAAAAKPQAAPPPRESWPDFRGPNRDGRYTDASIRTDWPKEGLPRLWKQPVGPGYASFVVANGRAFTMEQRRREEVVAAYDVETGRERWTNGWTAEFVESLGGDGPRATPTYHDGRVYALGALGELRCLDASTGAVVWRRNILADNNATNLDWGMAAAPLFVDDTVIVLPGGPSGRSVAAYHKATGDVVWTALDDRQAYTSPMVVTLGGVRQILVVSAARVMGVTTNQGRLLWEYPWVTYMGINVAQPVLLGDDRVFISAAYDHGAAAFQVTRTGDTFAASTLWESRTMKNKFSSSLFHRGYLYGLDESILACVDAVTGKLKWKGGRYGYGQVMLAGEHLIVLTEDGDAVLVSATPERHEEVGRFSAISGKTWSHPVIAGGRLLVRNIREMAAFDIRPLR